MAFRFLGICSSSIKKLHSPILYNLDISTFVKNDKFLTLEHTPVLKNQTRTLNFFQSYTAEKLWKSCTSVSNQGRSRGRAKGKKGMIKDLNRGQVIGKGKVNILWPGLSGPIMRGTQVVQMQKLPPDVDYEKKITALRDSHHIRLLNSRRVHSLERGWTSAKYGGRRIGPPDPVNDEPFEGFDSIVLEHKQVHCMSGVYGRVRRFSSFVITGNANGLCGIGLAKSPDARSGLQKAKNRAGHKLMYIERHNNHTVLHDFFSQFGSSKVFVSKKPEGYGLRCHRVIKAACEVIGIKDLRCKVEGSVKNYQNIIKAFLLGLLRQKSLQQLADEKQLHLVEMKKEFHYYPTVVATPKYVRKPSEVRSSEITDFTSYVLGGKVILEKKEWPPFFVGSKYYRYYRRKQERMRHSDEVRIRMYAEHGELRSFLTDKYPECKPYEWNLCKALDEKAAHEAAEAAAGTGEVKEEQTA